MRCCTQSVGSPSGANPPTGLWLADRAKTSESRRDYSKFQLRIQDESEPEPEPEPEDEPEPEPEDEPEAEGAEVVLVSESQLVPVRGLCAASWRGSQLGALPLHLAVAGAAPLDFLLALALVHPAALLTPNRDGCTPAEARCSPSRAAPAPTTSYQIRPSPRTHCRPPLPAPLPNFTL